MKQRNIKLITLTIILAITSNSLTSFAHSGRTDSNGGHKDNKNVSGLGNYHYHHGMEAHLHPNGVCPYSDDSSSTSNSAAQDKAYAEQIEKDKGYDQGYNDAVSEKSNNSSSSNSNFSEGYSLGYSKGVQVLEDEKISVKENATAQGYNSGYLGNSNESTSYLGKHKSVYTIQYDSSYKEGLDKRNIEITDAKAAGASLGLKDGYNKINRESFDYTGNYIDAFTDGYKSSYIEGEENLNSDILKYSNDSYISAFKNEKLDESAHTNEYIKASSLESYKKATDIFNNFFKNAPMLGESLEEFSNYAEGNDKIKIGNDNTDSTTFISINNKSKRKVTDISLFINALDENGYNSEVASSLIESFLKKDFIDSYDIQSSYQRTDNDYTYGIHNLKLNNKISKSAPKNFSIITVSKDDMIHEIKILKKEPKYIRKYKKI